MCNRPELSRRSLEKMIEVARRLSKPFDLHEALEKIVDVGTEVLQADRTSILLFDPVRDELYSEATSAREEIRFPASAGIAGECLRDGRIITVDDCYADQRFNPAIDQKTGYRSNCSISVPLIAEEGHKVGVLQCLNSLRGRFDESDVRLADTLAGFAALAIQRASNLDDRLRTAKLERDLSLAREIQMNLLPLEIPRCKGYDLAVFSQPAEETGGDIYNLIPLNGNGESDSLLILLADATGHGISAALSVTQVRAMLRIGVRVGSSLDELSLHLNNQLVADLPQNKFVTAFIGILDPAANRLAYHALGQAPILHVHSSGGICEKIGASSLPAGLLGIESLQPPAAIEFERGDLVVLLSDGYYEYKNSADQEFGAKRVADLLSANCRRSAQEILGVIRRAVEGFSEGAAPDDDLTAIVLKRL